MIPLLLALAATGWFAVRPGFGTFFLALMAFFVWAGATFVDFLLVKLGPVGKKLERFVREATGELPGPPDGSDPELLKLHQLLRQAEVNPDQRGPARKALRMASRLPELLAGFEAVLGEKLNAGELTHERYRAAGRRVYEITRGELQQAARKLVSGQGGFSDHLERSEAALVEMSRIGEAVSAMRGRGQSADDFESAIRDLRELAERTKRY